MSRIIDVPQTLEWVESVDDDGEPCKVQAYVPGPLPGSLLNEFKDGMYICHMPEE